MCAAAAFGSIYLYTTELSPTNHRGKMLGICDFSARIGQCLHNPLISYNMVLFRARYQHVMIKADVSPSRIICWTLRLSPLCLEQDVHSGLVLRSSVSRSLL